MLFFYILMVSKKTQKNIKKKEKNNYLPGYSHVCRHRQMGLSMDFFDLLIFISQLKILKIFIPI